RTPLHLACANGHVDVVTYLVENKCKLNLFDNDNRSPLMKAVQCQKEKCVAILLEHGADPNLADASGNTALHLAAAAPNASLAEMLLEHNAHIDAQNKEGYTPLILAVLEHHEEMVEFLLKKGADVHARDQCESCIALTVSSVRIRRHALQSSHLNSVVRKDRTCTFIYELLVVEMSSGVMFLGCWVCFPFNNFVQGFTCHHMILWKVPVSEKEGNDDSWHTSEEEELDFTPKKPQKPNLTLLMNASQQFKKNRETQCGTGNVFGDDQKICKELDEKMEGSVDAPVSFIAGCYERLQENITVISPKVMNNELSYESTPKQAVLQNVNNLQTRQEPLNKKSVIQEKLRQKGNFSSVDSETTDWKKEIPQSLSDSCGLTEKKSAFGDGFKSINGSQSAAENPRLESQRPKSDIFEYVGEEDAEEGYEEVDKKVCEALKQESENMHLIRCEENTRAVFSSTKVSIQGCLNHKGIFKGSTEISHQEALAENEESHSADKQLSPIPWEESKSFLKAKVVKKNESKRQSSKQKANQRMSSSSGNHFQVLDDSTFSETSQDEERPAAKTGSEKNKVSVQMDVMDNLDLTQSSDTTTEDVESPTPTYKEAMLLLEQLGVDHAGSVILLKIQNILLQYEQIIEREKSRYAALSREVRKLESEKEESQLIAEETQDLKSILAHQEVEWKSDIQSLKFSLKQEEEKRLRVEMLYEKTREQLRRKEDQYCKEMEKKQQLELHSGNLQTEIITLRKLLKQVEEERDETQRQLSQEKSARALQEGILNSHLWRQKELEEETRITIGKNSEESDTNEREKDLLYKNQLLQDEIAMLRLELDQVKLRHQEDEGKYLEENETLKEKNEDLKKELKLNEEALTQTVFQYNGQLNLLKTESAVLTSKLEQTKESKDRLETEIESFRSRLNAAVQDLERHQTSKSDVERTFQRERDEWLRLQDKLHHDLSDVRETNNSLSQQLSKAESKANTLENELHQLKQTLREKTLLLEMTQKELSQAQCQAKESDHARQLEKDQVSKFMIKQESMQERLAQLQSENLLLRQQLEDMQNKGIIKEKVVNDVQDRFNDIFNKLRADTEKQVYLMEERNKELKTKCTDLREQVFKYEADKVEREGMVRQLQQELADALKKQSMSEAALEVTTHHRSDLEEDKLRLQKELDKVKTKKLQDILLSSSGTNTTIKQLEEHVQRLEIENARLEATAKQQTNRIEALQKDLQTSASVSYERKKVKKLIELKRPVEVRLDQEMKRNIELQKECHRCKRLLNRAMKKIRMYEARERESQFNFQGEIKNRYSEMVNEVGRLRTKVSELSQQLELESKKCMQLEAQNQDLREELSALRGNHEILEKSKCQLKEEVANLRHRLETNMVDHSQIEQYKREMEERAGQEIRQKLQEVNLFLQTQAASQDRLEQIRASHHASLRNQLKHRIKDLECELDRIKNTQQDSIFQKESTQAEVEKYKELYLEEVKIRRCLANKLER
ncbi:Ankyrin repeat domain-containing protein 26, partial [Anas platyrhynchos]